ncbi:methyltransferase [Streptomyces sp. TX20-6-3]|uniref:methyltransferase n=1 Tax=Streptomyces sp. TX20-6-3 TaxID=3028705 RepID=UPI0029BEFFB1|nr:methyltransferase [Streptomyces sp. TX20-6-3]MDX2565340.1 methyltransferase [Streptomyces sp. TX20-6-3]
MVQQPVKSEGPDPAKIMQTGLGFWASKTLLAAIKLELFTFLGNETRTAEEIRASLGLHGHGLADFLDALASLEFLERRGSGTQAEYANSPMTATFLVKGKPSYLGSFFEMANDREYLFWANLEEGLRTGAPQNEIKDTGKESFEAIYADPDRLRQFTEAMSSIQLGAFHAFAQKFDFSGHQLMLDVGGSGAALSCIVATHNPGMACISYDLPALENIATGKISDLNLTDRIRVQSGDFFSEVPLPEADIITMGNILHSFDLPSKISLLKKAYDSLPKGGELAVIELIIDNDRRENTLALLMSLNMLIESDGGFNYTQADFEKWVKEVGFRSVRFEPLAGPVSAAIAVK